MIQLVKSKIEKLVYVNSESINELDKFIGAAFFIVKRDSTSVSPLQPEYIKAFESISNIKETDFDKKKSEIINILDTLVLDKIENGFIDNKQNEIMYGKEVNEKSKEIDFTILMVEQNNIDYFRTQESDRFTEPHERLVSHIMIVQNQGQFIVSIKQNSTLPEKIKTELLSKFNELGLLPMG